MALVLAGLYFPPLSVIPAVLGIILQDMVTIVFGKFVQRWLDKRGEGDSKAQ